MYNSFLDPRAQEDIDTYVEKIIKDLGISEPPVRLENVIELLRLDRQFYSSTNTGLLLETCHKLKVAGKQVLLRPSIVLDAIKKWDLRALYVPDKKRILIDETLPKPKQRWAEGHEIIHSIIPWHDSVLHGDQKQTLSIGCHTQIEAEANYGNGRLLFLQDIFTEQLFDSDLNFQAVKKLSQKFGNTMTTTLWRSVEAMKLPAVGFVSQHPKKALIDGQPSIRYFVRSREFADQFEGITGSDMFGNIQSYCYGNRGPIGKGEVVLTDSNGIQHIFLFETFFNGYDALTLGIHQHERKFSISI